MPLFLQILVRQLAHKWVVNLLLLLTMTGVVSLYVFILNTNRFTVRSMQLIMKNMGLNQFIIPAAASELDTYLCTDRQAEFPEATTRQAANHTELLSRYYVSVLQQRIAVSNQMLLLTGIQPVSRPDETQEKGNPVKSVAPGIARLGWGAAAALQARPGGRIHLAGRELTVAKVVPEQGTLEDYRIFLNLGDAQKMLNKPGIINLIQSFECLHVGGSLEEIHQFQHAALARLLPGFKQINLANISQGRYHARTMTEKYQYYLLGLVAVVTVLILVITGLQEVAERRYETGILLALGTDYPAIIGLYLGKTLLLAALASVVGFLLGGVASVYLTAPFLVTQTREIAIVWANLPPTVALICGIALVAELIPMIQLVRLDPCASLVEE